MAGAGAPDTFAPISVKHSVTTEVVLRLLGAVLQLVATWAIVQAFKPEAVGIYFRGFVISLGAAAILRAKYEIYMAHHIIGRRSAETGLNDGTLLIQLGRRVLLRSILVCCALLVLMADLDVQAPRLEPVLETYFPFVLAIPCVSLFSFIGEALRAANRTLLGTVIAAYAINISMILAVVLAPSGAPLAFYAWAYFAGSLVTAALAVGIARRAFPGDWVRSALSIEPEILQAMDEREVIGISRALLLWGPLGILAVAAPALQVAEFAVCVRTAMIVDYFLPALNLNGAGNFLRQTPSMPPPRFLVTQLYGALLYSSIFSLVLLASASATLGLFGYPYKEQFTIYAVLLGMQWVNGIGRPAIRQVVVSWDAPRILTALRSGALAAVLVCGLTINLYGALSAAVASLIGALILNAWAITSALRGVRSNDAPV